MTRNTIGGFVVPGFEKVREQFEEHFESEGEVGAALCIEYKGKKVVDIWGGHQDGAKTKSWDENTLTNVWSTTKGAMAATIANLVSLNLLDYSSPVAEYWPEFAVFGKENITVAQLFSHQAGLAGLESELAVDELFDVESVANRLAERAPQWEVGTRSGYHALSIGYLAEELVRRVTGRTLSEYFNEVISGSLELEFYMGLPCDRENQVSEMLNDGYLETNQSTFNQIQKETLINLPTSPNLPNERRWRAMGIPSAGGTANARGVAGLYSHLLSDFHSKTEDIAIASRETLLKAQSVQIDNVDLILGFPQQWGIGFSVNAASGFYGPSKSAFGHHGWGGSSGFVDPEKDIAFGYVMNYLRDVVRGDPRASNLIRETYAAIDAVEA